MHVPVNSKTAHPPTGRSPGIWLALSSVQWGIWPKISCQNGCQRSDDSARKPRSRVIALVDSTWVFCCCRFIELYRGICLCLKCGTKTSWTRRSLWLKIFQNLFPKVSDSVYIRLFHECMAWQGGGYDPLWSSNGWSIWPSKLAT